MLNKSNYNYNNILIQKGLPSLGADILYCIELIIEYSKVLAVFREATE